MKSRIAALMAVAALTFATPLTAEAGGNDCWGQATAAFAQLGLMGPHASEQPTPRIGLPNLAKALYEQGVIPEPTLEALGAFVADALGLDVSACQ